jgi:hypothetical protein
MQSFLKCPHTSVNKLKQRSKMKIKSRVIPGQFIQQNILLTI